MKIKGDFESRQVWLDGKELNPYPSQLVYNHSPDGFCWGYTGSGPSQLALAICLELLPNETALRVYQDFKFDVVAKWKNDFEFELDILQWLKNKEFKNE
jgi:hypothetical protein